MNNYQVRGRHHLLSRREYRFSVRAVDADEARVKAKIRDPQLVQVNVKNRGPVEAVTVEVPPCFLCKRTDMVADGLYQRIDFRGRTGIQLVCDECVSRAEEAS